METVHIKSTQELDNSALEKIKDIFLESNCPNESLINTFNDCKGLIGGNIIFGDEDNFEYTLNCLR